ncbi:MAG: RDD family protein [Planctomycetes bacterium]|nr:RDD family protein [Planctomycetota bacterium]MCB9936194.1 RDD family protein [Planctomycetota bacterium]
MKHAPDDDLPELLRRRILRQRKRLKFVRISFAITAVISVLLLFGANQTQTLAPNSRLILVVPHGDSLWLIDQHLDLAGQNMPQEGSFALVRVQGENILAGTRYEGLVRSATPVNGGHIGITTPSRFMLFNTGGDEWQRDKLESLGLNDPTASPVVVSFNQTLWLCWASGAEVMVQPFGRPEVAARSVHKARSPELDLQARVTADAVWLSIIETRNGDLTLLSFTPSIEAAVSGEPAEDKDADETPDPAPEAPAQLRTAVQRNFSSEVTSNVRRASFAVIASAGGPRPVVALMRKEESNRTWQLMVWTRDEKSSKGSWVDALPPARDKPATGLELTNFVTLAARGDKLQAVYSEAGEVRTSETALGADGSLEWSQPRVLPLDKTNGPAVYIIWISLLFGVVLIMASQGVWLLLNRERPLDRTLVNIIENHEKEAGKKEELPKLLYANPLARAVSLLLDIAITSPVVILLQSIYGYSWEQAYGFLAIGTVTSFDANLLPTLQATLVTLLVLSIYGMVCELLWGRTFGKALFRLRVVDADGEAPAAWRIVVRNALKVFELIHWAVLLIPMGLMMMTGKQQRLGDLAAGTFVIVDVVPDEAPDDIDI